MRYTHKGYRYSTTFQRKCQLKWRITTGFGNPAHPYVKENVGVYFYIGYALWQLHSESFSGGQGDGEVSNGETIAGGYMALYPHYLWLLHRIIATVLWEPQASGLGFHWLYKSRFYGKDAMPIGSLPASDDSIGISVAYVTPHSFWTANNAESLAALWCSSALPMLTRENFNERGNFQWKSSPNYLWS